MVSLGIVFAGECLQHVPVPQSTIANIEYLVVDFPCFQVVLGKVPFEISKNLTVAVHMNSYISHVSGGGCRHPSRQGDVLFFILLRSMGGLDYCMSERGQSEPFQRTDKPPLEWTFAI